MKLSPALVVDYVLEARCRDITLLKAGTTFGEVAWRKRDQGYA
jgi:hypothetical protein